MNRSARRSLLALAATAALALGCGRPFVPATPPGFVDLGDDRYPDDEYRATTAEGVVLGIRAQENDPKGDLGFWAHVIENKMRESGGYAMLGKSDVKARSGLSGVQMRFGHDEGKTPHLYLLTVFVDDDHVFLLEAGGTKAEIERQQAQIDWAVRNFLPR
ncbi:MAG: serine/threonine protein kinase [Polyangiaceae bacterium]|nr:serine/threonine protein kinase [Polyangiaceae bacterium]